MVHGNLVGWAGGKDGAIIDISGEPMELPGLRKSEEGYEVDGGQDGGQRGCYARTLHIVNTSTRVLMGSCRVYL